MAKRGARVGAARRGAAAAAIDEEAQLTQVQKAVFERSGLPTPQLLPVDPQHRAVLELLANINDASTDPDDISSGRLVTTRVCIDCM